MSDLVPGMRRVVCVTMFCVALAVALPASAGAAITDVFDADVSCSVQGDGVRFCGSSTPRSTVEAFDGVPIDVNAAFPPEPASGPDGPYPLVMLFHGYGGGKIGLGGMQEWLDRGYATFSMTDRGFRESCGSAASKSADPSGCADGFVRLIDNRYEVRDAQEFAGTLVDEGLVDPDAIGATGGSYGGGVSLALAALNDRMAMPNGSLVEWESPNGVPLHIAAAAPFITWSDLAYSLAPNGSTLDYVADAPYQGRFGVMKESLVSGLYFSGLAAPAFYAPEGTEPSADLIGWRNRLLAGEPYDGDPTAEGILDQITSNHSSYYIDDSVEPAPLLLANGFTDDLFPVDEMVRYYNRTRTNYPDAKLAMIAGEISGHPRSQGKSKVLDALAGARAEWFAHFLKDTVPEPPLRVTAFTQTCPGSAEAGGPFGARDWARLAKGEVRLDAADSSTIEPDGGSNSVAATFNPVTGGGACAQVSGDDLPGAATYRLDPAEGDGYTLLGSPTVIARFETSGTNSQVAARLLDVGPDNQETLVARGLWRPTSGSGKQVFQLHPNGWEFAPGHVAKLELLPADADDGPFGGYGRASDGQRDVIVSDLELRLPVRERPGAVPGVVKTAAPKKVPAGYELASDFAGLGSPGVHLRKGGLKLRGDKLLAAVKCPGKFDACTGGKLVVKRAGKGKSIRVAEGPFSLPGGETERVAASLSGRAKRYFKRHRGLRVEVSVKSAEGGGKDKQRRRAGR